VGHVSETAVIRISNKEKEQLENSAVLFIKKLCVKPIFTIGIKHKKIVFILYKIMKECKNI